MLGIGKKKMRLIDADRLFDNLERGVRDTSNQVFREIMNTPTVEAIPIEWILKRAELCTADYTNCLHYTVEAWQTEQKYMVNGRWKFPKDREKENGYI